MKLKSHQCRTAVCRLRALPFNKQGCEGLSEANTTSFLQFNIRQVHEQLRGVGLVKYDNWYAIAVYDTGGIAVNEGTAHK